MQERLALAARINQQARTPHHHPSSPFVGTDGKRLEEVSQEKSVRSDTSVLTLIQSSAGNSRGSFGGGAGGRLAGSGGFGGGGSEGIGRLAA